MHYESSGYDNCRFVRYAVTERHGTVCVLCGVLNMSIETDPKPNGRTKQGVPKGSLKQG